MAPSKYLLHVNSRPTQVSDDLWSQWYTTEHLPDLVNSKTSTRATFYKEIASALTPQPDDPRKWLAIYQTEFEECLDTENYKSNVRHDSNLFRKEGATSNANADNGDFNARYYGLLQTYDPNNVGEVPAKQILLAYMNPEDPEDYEKWYREEHLNMLSKSPGYKRSLRYTLGPKHPLTKDASPPPYLTIHEVDSVDQTFTSREAAAASETPWTKKHLAQSKPFILRAFELVHTEGY